MHRASLHGLHCIQSGSIAPQCMGSSAFIDAAWNPLHSIGMLWAMLHIIQCIQLGCIWPRSIDSTAYNKDQLQHNAWNPLHSMMLHWIQCTQSRCFGPCCIKSTAFNRVPFLHTAGNTMHSIGMHFNTLHGLHCCIMDYTAAIMLHIIHCIQLGWFGPCCIKSSAFNRDA